MVKNIAYTALQRIGFRERALMLGQEHNMNVHNFNCDKLMMSEIIIHSFITLMIFLLNHGTLKASCNRLTMVPRASASYTLLVKLNTSVKQMDIKPKNKSFWTGRSSPQKRARQEKKVLFMWSSQVEPYLCRCLGHGAVYDINMLGMY